MTFQTFSKKQMKALTWWCAGSPYRGYDAIICDGAVRSGKTLCMSLSFVLWAFSTYDCQSFALCGKTLISLRRNVTTPLIQTLRELGFCCREKRAENLLILTKKGRENRFYLFGGKDEGSAALIQGTTLAGVLLDEVALMPRSFVEQALARCSVTGSKLWFNCNPEHPFHWFYTEWIQKAEEKNALYLHFTMEDNPALSPEIRKRYEALYTGTFYERFVQGQWVAAEGLVYPMFSVRDHVRVLPDSSYEEYVISCDYGTVNPSSFGLWGLKNGIWCRVDEYYFDSRREQRQRTDEEHYRALEQLAGTRSIRFVLVDPSAASFIECIRRHGRFTVRPARNDVLDGIRRVGDALSEGKICFSERCKDSIREFSLYVWEDNCREDRPVKQHDHAMDDIRYFVSTVIAKPDDGFWVLSCERS